MLFLCAKYKIELFGILKKGKITYKESPFRPIIQDIKDKLSKSGDKLIKKGLHYVEKMKELTEPLVKIIKEKLIKFKNELIKKNRIKKDNAWYYGGIIYNGIKDIRYLFNEDEDEDEDKITYKEFTFKSINVDTRKNF